MQREIIVHANFAKGFRGGERQTQLLIEQLSIRGYKQRLLVRKNSKLGRRCIDIKNLTIKELSKPYIISGFFVKNAKVVHAHETKALQFAFFINLFLDIPYIVTRRVDNSIKNNYFNRLLYTKAKDTVVISKAVKKTVLDITSNANITIIPSAYSDFTVNKKNVLKLKKRFKGKYIIGNIGALDNAHKGQYYLIESAKQLQKIDSNIHIILIGSGIDELKYREQAKELNNITFEGFVDNIGEYLSIFDLFVFPSLHEGLGSILFDVMQFNIPIIATDVGGIIDIIHHDRSGLLVKPKDSNQLTASILKLIDDPMLSRELAKEAKKSLDKYSPKTMCESYLNVY